MMTVRRLCALLCALVLALPPLPAMAESRFPPDASSMSGTVGVAHGGTGATVAAAAMVNLTGLPTLNIKAAPYLAKCDAITGTDGAITSGSNIFTSAAATFTAADVGKVMTVAGAGAKLSLTGAVPAAAGTGVLPWDTFTLADGSVAWATQTKVVSATINAGGTGGTNGTGVTVTGATTGATYTVNIAGNTISAVTAVATGGTYGALNGLTLVAGVPQQLATESVTGQGLSGAILNVVMGAKTLTASGPLVNAAIANPITPSSTSGSAAGVTLTGTYSNRALHTTIAGFTDAHTVTLAANAAATVSGANYLYGTDDSAAFDSAANDLVGTGTYGNGGTIRLPGQSATSNGCIRDTAWSIPYTGTNPAKMRGPLQLAGLGMSVDPSVNDAAPLGGSRLYLTYDGLDALHPGKIDARASGVLGFDNLVVDDGLVDTIPMVFTTNARVVSTRNARWTGSQACSGATCQQDVFVFGGDGSGAIRTDSASAAFQAYGAVIESTFDRNRRVATFNSAANGVVFRDVMIGYTNGSSEAFGSPFYLSSAAHFGQTANVWNNGSIEVTSYPFCWTLLSTGVSPQTSHVETGTYCGDRTTGVTQGGAYIGSTTAGTSIWIPSYLDGGVQMLNGPGAPSQTYIATALNSGGTQFASPGGNRFTVGGALSAAYLNVAGGSTNSGDGALLSLKNGSTTIGFLGNKSAFAGGAYDATLVFGSSTANPINFYYNNSLALQITSSVQAILGTGSSNPNLTINSGTGTAGGYLNFQKGGVAKGQYGTDSGIFGHNNDDLAIDATGGVRIYHGNGQVWWFDGNSHIDTGAQTAPALTSCGTGSPAIAGTDTAGEVTMGTTATGCVITFAAAYTSAPFCTVAWQGTPLASQSYTVSTTAITTVQTSTSGNKLDYHCIGRSGG